MKNKFLIFTIIILAPILIIGILTFFFWYFGILKKEAQSSEVILKLKTKLEFINNYSFESLSNYLRNLPTEFLSLPTITPEEIGKNNLFLETPLIKPKTSFSVPVQITTTSQTSTRASSASSQEQ